MRRQRHHRLPRISPSDGGPCLTGAPAHCHPPPEVPPQECSVPLLRASPAWSPPSERPASWRMIRVLLVKVHLHEAMVQARRFRLQFGCPTVYFARNAGGALFLPGGDRTAPARSRGGTGERLGASIGLPPCPGELRSEASRTPAAQAVGCHVAQPNALFATLLKDHLMTSLLAVLDAADQGQDEHQPHLLHHPVRHRRGRLLLLPQAPAEQGRRGPGHRRLGLRGGRRGADHRWRHRHDSRDPRRPLHPAHR